MSSAQKTGKPIRTLASSANAPSSGAYTDVRRMPIGVVGDSMFGKECRREDWRSVGGRNSEECSAEVRATVVVKKRGNARGSKE